MRVAHILRKYQPAQWGGTETVIQELSEELAGRQVESIVFCPAPGRSSKMSPTQPENDPLVEVGCRLKRYKACVPVWGMPEKAYKQALSIGGNIYSFDLPGMLMREPGLDVIHSHALGRIAGIAQSVARRRRIPFLVTIHGGALDIPKEARDALKSPSFRGLEWGKIYGWWWRARHVLKDADAILTCNPTEAALLKKRYPSNKIIVHPHGLDTDLYEINQRPVARSAFPGIAGRQILLCVARIDPVKNQAWMVNEMPSILKRYPDVLLVLVGSCTNEAYGISLQKTIQSNGLENYVLLTGGLPPGDPRLIGLIQSASAMVLPSYAETFGLVILEAWAAGTPVISSKSSGALSLITHGENGWLFDTDCPPEFHAALDLTLSNKDLTRTITDTAGQRVTSEYNTAKLAGRMYDLYQDLSLNYK